MRDAFHQAAVADENVGPVVDDRVAGTVELRREQPLGERHADRVGESLAERPGRRFDAGRDADFRMARRHRVQLAEALELVDRQRVARSGAAARTAASSRVRWTARSDRDRPSADWPGCGAGGASTARRRFRPCPWACRDGRSWPPARHPSPAREWRWRASACRSRLSSRRRRRMRRGKRMRSWSWGIEHRNARPRMRRRTRQLRQSAKIIAYALDFGQ